MGDDQHPSSSGNTCPALSLPVEITSEIFLHCIAPADILCEPANPSDRPPVVLTRICRDWRLIVLSMPKLWSDVRLEFGGSHGIRRGCIDSWWVSFLETWFSRAEDQPLTMIISNLNQNPDDRLIGLLDLHRSQWQNLTLRLPFNTFYLFKALESTLPMLERLVLEAHGIPRFVDTPINTFQLAPMLNHVSLGGYLRPSYLILPWNQLTSVELTAARAEDCLECLRGAPKVVECSFGIVEGMASLRPVPARPHLRTLTVSGASPTAIFPYTTMPALEELNLVGRSLNTEDLSHISFFVSRSRCQLRRLRLHFISELLTTPAIQLLEALPSLERCELAATEAKTITTLFSSLCGDSKFLPQLQNLSISHHRISDSNMVSMFEAMANMLIYRGLRTPEHVQLHSFALAMQCEETAPPMWVKCTLQELVDGGMNLDIRNRYERCLYLI
ncbi:F-box domain-containing protein [Mycena venus]|uniref:F-box domain-containing protein n=1 Tax=Mycena venus TaxID=2733690 RepID=A0A8H7DCU7_9AGAR|nr:F-box domain-containing protein [Mycena venus]